MEEGSKFVPLNAEDPMYGPPVSCASQLFYIVACLSCEYMETLKIIQYVILLYVNFRRYCLLDSRKAKLSR